MNEWLKSHTYLADWLAATFGFIACCPVFKEAIKSVWTMFAVWFVVSSTILVLRLTMSQEAMKEVLKNLLVIACVYAVFQSTQNGLKTQSEA